MTITLTNETWNKYKNSDELLILDFWAPWCGPCKSLSQTIEKIILNYPKQKIYTINTDENNELVQKFKIRNLPTLIFYKNGEEVKRVSGNQTQDVIEQHIKQLS